jgi:hypothetical protein
VSGRWFAIVGNDGLSFNDRPHGEVDEAPGFVALLSSLRAPFSKKSGRDALNCEALDA